MKKYLLAIAMLLGFTGFAMAQQPHHRPVKRHRVHHRHHHRPVHRAPHH